MTSKFTREQRINEVKELIANAEEWAGFYEHPIHDKPQREMFEGMAKVMSEHLAALAEMDSEPVAESEQLAIENFRSAMEGIGHIRRTLEETFGGLHGTHVEPDALAECKAICDAIYSAYGHAPPAPVVPDEMLCEFYEVSNWPDLVIELVKHIEQLQDSAKRNVKPWEDTFPETLLPVYIDKVKQADEACRAAML